MSQLSSGQKLEATDVDFHLRFGTLENKQGIVTVASSSPHESSRLRRADAGLASSAASPCGS